MARIKYHVTPAGDGDWKVTRTGTQRADSIVENKADAIERAKELAKKNDLSQVIIHDKDNKIQTEYTYGDDPEKHKG